MQKYTEYKDSGVEWLGEIPSHWEVKKVTHIFNKIGSGTTPTAGLSKYYEDGEVNWLQTGDLNDSYIAETSKKITKKAINSRHIPGLPTRKQEFGSRHRDSLRCCQTHAFLPTMDYNL